MTDARPASGPRHVFFPAIAPPLHERFAVSQGERRERGSPVVRLAHQRV
ncbi:hypothetical protein [Paraburkholderia sp. C35]|nr:hypothetical protein [Paraburkholderia sp. C35]